MDNVQKALAAQRKRRADIQAASDAKKVSYRENLYKKNAEMQAAYDAKSGSKSPVSIPTSYSPSTTRTASVSKPDGYSDYMKTVRSESFKTSASKKSSTPKSPSIAQRRASFAAANAPIQAKATKPSVSGMGVAGLAKAAPKAINVTPSRTYTDKEKQINALLMTGKKKNGTMKASAQRKIQRIRKK
jgi:hypothetical protein